jgi:hypothetical protein
MTPASPTALTADSGNLVELPAGRGPYLLAIIDAEEEFDWVTFSPTAVSVTSMRHQERAQLLFARHGVRPTYAVDFPVASQEEGYRPLLEFLADGSCEIGTQLHPWVNPPLEEEFGERFSYPGNLPRALELEKLRRLTRTIEDNLRTTPKLYRAGRFGAGPNTAGILEELGYEIDCSVLPWTDLSHRFGPDYGRCTAKPFWFGRDRRLLEIPVSVGLVGLLAGIGAPLYQAIASPVAEMLKLPGVFARLRLLDRIRLTPEGTSIAEAKRATRAMLRHDGDRVFVLTYHTPSLEPGNTSYTRTQHDLDVFLSWIEEYLDFFFGEIGGTASTPGEIRALALGMMPGKLLVG